MNRRQRFGIVLSALLLVLSVSLRADAQIVSGLNPRSVSIDGHTRSYNVYAPASYSGAAAVPLVVDFHGFLTSHEFQRSISGWQQLADAEGFLVAFPLGLFGQAENPADTNDPFGPSWNSGDLCCGQAVTDQIDDVTFARALVGLVAAEANVDLRRVYATGLSNGGALTQRLACEAADAFAAFAPLSFPIGFDPLSQCTPSRPVPILAFAGLTDLIVPYAGGPFVYGPDVPSATQSFHYWRDRDGCGPGAPDETEITGAATCETYTGCADGVEVELCSLVGAVGGFGHVLYLNEDLDIAQTAWDFLSRFTLPSLCLATPAVGCREAGKASLAIKTGDAPKKRRLTWTWKKGDETLLDALGDPTDSTEYALCVYDRQASTPLLETTVAVPAGGAWKAAGSKGFKYKSATGQGGGAKVVQLGAAEIGKAKAVVKAGGVSFAAPNAFDSEALFADGAGVVVQLVNDNGECWTSDLVGAKKNTPASFKAVSP